MSEFNDSIEGALNARLLGANEFHSSDKSLNLLLSLQYRVHYHVFREDAKKRSACKVLLTECQKFQFQEENPLQQKLWHNLAGILNYHLSCFEEAEKHLAESNKIRLENGPFGTLLCVENLYYSGLLRGDQFNEFCIKHLPQALQELPKVSHAITFHYLDVIIGKLSMSWEQVHSSFPPNVITCYIAIVSDPHGHDSEMLKLGNKFLDTAKFPSAEESNDLRLEQFHSVLYYYFRRTKSELSAKWHDFIVESAAKTFQSMAVTKTAMAYFGIQKELRESILNFKIFLDYNKNYRDLSRGQWFDIVSVIEAYEFIVTRSEGRDIPKIFSFAKVVSDFEEHLKDFYESFSLPLIKKERSLDWASESIKVSLPVKVSDVLSKSWNAFYENSINSLSGLLQEDHCYYLANALAADPNCTTISFNYAFALAQKREITQAIKFLKTVLLEKEPENYKGWHLLALCESVKEDKNTSFKIVCSVLQALQVALSEGAQVSVNDRWQCIHLKLTQLALVQDLFGLDDALELLPELFELFSLAFPPDLQDCNLSPEYNRTKEYLHQTVWLFAVKLYMNRGFSADAREALDESRKITDKFQNLNNDLAEGYLHLGNDGKKALRSFEKVLFYDPYNIDAIIGFAKCLMPEKQESPSHELILQKQSTAGPSGFSGDKDRAALFARLKLTLEELVEKSIEGYHAPEVWWYLSRVYENYEDSERLESSLWNCVKFQELQPIREFRNCNF